MITLGEMNEAEPSAADRIIGTPILKKMSNGFQCERDRSSSHAGLETDWNDRLPWTGHWLAPFPIAGVYQTINQFIQK